MREHARVPAPPPLKLRGEASGRGGAVVGWGRRVLGLPHELRVHTQVLKHGVGLWLLGVVMEEILRRVVGVSRVPRGLAHVHGVHHGIGVAVLGVAWRLLRLRMLVRIMREAQRKLRVKPQVVDRALPLRPKRRVSWGQERHAGTLGVGAGAQLLGGGLLLH